MNLDQILAALSLDEKAVLTHGEDLWSTHAIERLGVPKIVLTDGPNGARGPIDPEHAAVPSTCVPCGSSLGATWDPPLIARIGALIGREAREKGCRVLLAPTVNTHRSPLAGRNFECYSEDPLLAGRLAAGFVRGVQAEGVAVTVKHFAANDSEHERYVSSSQVDPRALREIYLLPFELAVKDGGALGIMTAYNRVNGVWCSEHGELLQGVLREDWGFDGFVVSDWFAAGSTVASAHAGLDLEMPGPGRFFGPALAEAVRAGEVEERVLDARVRNVLRVWDRIGALTDDEATAIVPMSDDERDELVRRAAAESMVLLKNDAVLPFDRPALSRLAVVGPNADRAQIMGGGSASLTPRHRTSPLSALREHFGQATVVHEPGCVIDRYVTPMAAPLEVQFFGDTDLQGPVVHERRYDSGRVTIFGSPSGVGADGYSFRATATVEVGTGRHEMSLVQVGPARVFVDGALVIDGVPDSTSRGRTFYGAGSAEARVAVDLEAGRHEIVVEYRSAPDRPLQGVIVGLQPFGPDDLVERAVAAARDADAVVVVVGTTDDWESEGFDRDTLHLPGDQDELIRRVLAVNPRAVVVLNAGAPVAMPWIDEAPAVLVCGLGGEEMAAALAEVLSGAREPAGRLPTTYPRRLEDTPSFLSFPGEFGEVRYDESIFVGYRWYDTRDIAPLFPFGHGLSFTTWSFDQPRLATTSFVEGSTLEIAVPVTNTGHRRGAQVVQCYVEPLGARVSRPRKELKAFTKIWLDAGQETLATMHLDDRSFAYWFPGDGLPADTRDKLRMPLTSIGSVDDQPRWRIDPGRYRLHVGVSSAAIAHTVEIEVVAPD